MKLYPLLLIMFVLCSFSVYGSLTDGMIHYYSFDVNQEDDFASNDWIVGEASNTSTDCVLNNCYKFNGTATGGTNLTLTDNTIFNNTEEMSISMWITFNTIPSDNTLPIILQTTTQLLWFYDSRVTGNGTQLGLYSNETSVFSSYHNDTVNTLYHYVQTYNKTHVTVYRNNVVVDSLPLTGLVSNASSKMIMGQSPTFKNRNFNGTIDEVGFWTRALTISEVSEVYNSGTGFNTTTINLTVTIINPDNGTGINGTTNINYTISGVNENVNCSLVVNNVNQAFINNLTNQSTNFTYLTAYGTQGLNFIDINCTDLGMSHNDSLTLFVDTILPVIVDINYTNFGMDVLNGSNVTGTTLDLHIITNDTNNYLFNISIFNATGEFFSDQKTGIIAYYTYNRTIEINETGRFNLSVRAADAYGNVLINTVIAQLQFNFTVAEANITVNLFDSNTLALITSNITVQLVGSIFQYENLTATGITRFTFPFNSDATDIISLRAFSTETTDYPIVIREFNVSPQQSLNISVYLTNASDTAKTGDVTFRVLSQIERERTSGATISIFKQEPTTGDDLFLTQITTDQDGEATTKLEYDTVFYKYFVDYQGSRVYSSATATTIPSTKDLIVLYVTLQEDFTEFYYTIYNANVGLTFTKVSNSSGYVTLDYSGLNSYEYCMHIYNTSYLGTTLHYNSCVTGTTGTFDSPTITVTNVTAFSAFATLDTNDGEGQRVVKSISFSIGESLSNFVKAWGDDTLFFPIIIIIVALFGFMANVYVGPIILIGGFVGLYYMGITQITMSSVMLIVSLAVFSLFVITRRNKT